MDRWWNDDRDFFGDEEDGPRRGYCYCPNCGDEVPEDHCDTDSGDCISCEDRRYDERREADIYALCLTGLQPKKKTRKKES